MASLGTLLPILFAFEEEPERVKDYAYLMFFSLFDRLLAGTRS